MVEAGFTFVLLLTTCIGYREVAVASFREFINDHHHHHLTHMYRGGACFYSICSLPSNLALPNLGVLPRSPPCNILIRTKYAKTEAISQSRLHHHSSSSLPSRIESRNAKKRICSMIHHTAKGYRKLPTTYMYLLPPTSDVTSPDNNI